MAITIIALIAGIVIGALIGTVLQRNKITQAVADTAMLKTQADNLQTRLNELQAQNNRQLAEQKNMPRSSWPIKSTIRGPPGRAARTG